MTPSPKLAIQFARGEKILSKSVFKNTVIQKKSTSRGRALLPPTLSPPISDKHCRYSMNRQFNESIRDHP